MLVVGAKDRRFVAVQTVTGELTNVRKTGAGVHVWWRSFRKLFRLRKLIIISGNDADEGVNKSEISFRNI